MGLIGAQAEKNFKGDKGPERLRRHGHSNAISSGRKLNTATLISEKTTVTRCQSLSVFDALRSPIGARPVPVVVYVSM